MKDKIDFIKELLGSEKIVASQKERRNFLIAREFKNPSRLDPNISAEIQLIKQRLNVIEQKVPEIKSSNGLKEEFLFHNPNGIVTFLKNFKNNTALKWSTHTWDSVDKYPLIDEFINGLNIEKKTNGFNDLFNCNKDLYTLIRYFLYNPVQEFENETPTYGWPNMNEIKIGWQSNNNLLINWCRENYGNKINTPTFKYPMEFPLPENLLPKDRINGKYITTFEDVVNLFKNEIEFRGDYLYNEIKKRARKINDFNVTIDASLKGETLLTYTRGVLQGIERIFEMFKKNELSKEIHVWSERQNDCFHLNITQIGSFPTKKIHTRDLKNFIGGDLNAVIAEVFSLCDYSIISRFKDQTEKSVNGELILLSEGSKGIVEKNKLKSLATEPQFRTLQQPATGFTHQFKFFT